MNEALRAITKRIYEEKGGGEDARNALYDAIIEEEELIQEAVLVGVNVLLHNAQASARDAIQREKHANNPPPKVYSKEMIESVRFSVGKYFNWPLMNGTPLGKATKAMILADADRFRANRIGNARNEMFLRSVAARLKDNQTVEEAFRKESELERLMKRATQDSESELVAPDVK